MDLLRWFRFTWAAGIAWDRADQRDARDFSRWLQLSGRDGKVTRPRSGRTARRCCAAGFTDRDLIRYVARVRAGTPDRAEDMALDPLATEAVLRRALGQDAPYVTDPWTRLRSAVALLTVLFGDLALGESSVDALLAEARALADRWLTELANGRR